MILYFQNVIPAEVKLLHDVEKNTVSRAYILGILITDSFTDE